jgi:hypothetical protein
MSTRTAHNIRNNGMLSFLSLDTAPDNTPRAYANLATGRTRHNVYTHAPVQVTYVKRTVRKLTATFTYALNFATKMQKSAY